MPESLPNNTFSRFFGFFFENQFKLFASRKADYALSLQMCKWREKK